MPTNLPKHNVTASDQSKNTVSLTNQSKNSSSFSVVSKHSTTFAESSKHNSSFSESAKNPASFVNQSKHNSTVSDQAKNNSSFTASLASIRPWRYDEIGFTYRQALDLTGRYQIFYDEIGSEKNATDQTKNVVSISDQAKTIHPWKYNETGFTYREVFDLSGRYKIYYDSIGQNTFVNLPKS